jgi:hypothetical protein
VGRRRRGRRYKTGPTKITRLIPSAFRTARELPQGGDGVGAVLGLLDRIANRGAHDSSPLTEEEVRTQLISIYPELASALFSSEMPPKQVKDTGKVVTDWFNKIAEANYGKEGLSNWHHNWKTLRGSEDWWREVFLNIRNMRYSDFIKLYVGQNGQPPGVTNPTKAVMDDGLSEIVNFFENQRGEKREESGTGKKRRPLGEGEPEIGQRPVAARTGEEVGMSGITAMHANADSMAQQGDMKPEADRPPGVSAVAMPADDRPIVITPDPIQVTPEMPGQQEAPQRKFSSVAAFRKFARDNLMEGNLGDNSVLVLQDLLRGVDQVKHELPEVKEEFAKLVHQAEYWPEIVSETQVRAWLESLPGADTASIAQKVKLLNALMDGESGSPFGPALIPAVQRAVVKYRNTLMNLPRKPSVTVEELPQSHVTKPLPPVPTGKRKDASTTAEEVTDHGRMLKFERTAPTPPRTTLPVVEESSAAGSTEPLLEPITEEKKGRDPRAATSGRTEFIKEFVKQSEEAEKRTTRSTAVAADDARYLRKNTTRGKGRKKAKDGMDVGKKKRAPKQKPDPTSDASKVAKAIQSEIVSNPEREKPSNYAVNLAVKDVMAREHPNLQWGTLTGNKAAKQNYLRLSANVRRLITGQGKKPHEYAMLGHHWSENKEGEVRMVPTCI